MKVLLVNPPTLNNQIWVREGRCQQFDIWGAAFPPLSLASVAGQIKEIAEPLIIDSGAAKLGFKETIKKIVGFAPELLFISSATPTIKNDLGLFAGMIKKILPPVKIATIGIHVSVLSRETLMEFPAVDFVIRREPEITAKELVSVLAKGGDLASVRGLAFRKGGEIIVNPEREFAEDLDSLELPFWPAVDFDNYRMPVVNKPFNLITFAKGCSFNCKFCASHQYTGHRIRKRNPEKIISEIEDNLKRGIRDFLFWTESLTADRDYLLSVLEAIKNADLRKKIRWVANSRVDSVDEELLGKMKEAGCWQVAFGLEFGNNEILKLAQKGGDATLAQAGKAVELARKIGLVADGHFILGYPGETEETLKDTINFAVSLPLAFAHFYVATPFVGSRLYEEAMENGWLADSDWSKISQNTANLKTEFLEPETVDKYVASAYRRFYLRPKTIFRIVRISRSIPQFFNIFKLGGSFAWDILRKGRHRAE